MPPAPPPSPPTAPPVISTRLLPAAEWPTLLDLQIEPFASFGLPDPAHWLIVGAFEGARLVAVAGLYEAVHNDPWWIHPDYRHSPTVVQRLWSQIGVVLQSLGVDTVQVTVADDRPEVQTMVERLGYQPAPGKLYIVHFPHAPLSRR